MPRDHLSEANRDDGEALRASGELVNSETFSLGNGSEVVCIKFSEKFLKDFVQLY